MNYVILSAAHHYFTGDWDEEAPKWSPNLDDAYHFTSKEIALETMRKHIGADQAAERIPGFAGARTASIQSEVLRIFKRRGCAVEFHESGVMITVKPEDGQKARTSFPSSVCGVPVSLQSTLKQRFR